MAQSLILEIVSQLCLDRIFRMRLAREGSAGVYKKRTSRIPIHLACSQTLHPFLQLRCLYSPHTP